MKFINATELDRKSAGNTIGRRRLPMRVTSRLRSYSFALALCILATIMSWISRAPSSCLHLGVVICTLYGENGAGLLSIGLSIPKGSSKRFLPPSKTGWIWGFPSAVPSSNYTTAVFGRKTVIPPEPHFASHFRCLITVPRNFTMGTGEDSSKDGFRQRLDSLSNLRQIVH